MARASRPDLALGVDIGGTFTDFALLDRRTGRLSIGKVLTDHRDLVRGVAAGAEGVLDAQPAGRGAVRAVIHGTTLATNALIERRGTRTALLVTRGFRDVLEMARESRYDIYDVEIDLPPPLVPRARVHEVTERVDAHGETVAPLDEAEARATARTLRGAGVEAVAVCFLHAFRDPAHERRMAEIIAEEAPGIAVSLSSDVVPDVGEYERASTTVANAYVQPLVARYLARLAAALEDLGVPARPLVITSDGGTVGIETAVRHPVRLVESGPAGGALAATYFGRQAGLDRLIAFDMGGTTAKVCVIDDGEPERSSQFEVGRVYRFAKGSGLPLKLPVLDMIEIGAGGGSIADADALGLLRVGPQSAGSSPGPACYGLGGREPTVTDADLHLGYLDAGYFLGGSMALDADAAARAIEASVARPLDLSLERAAWGIHTVVNDHMARAAKVHCLERGKDPREYTLVAFGGAGPVHAYRVAEALGLRGVLYPARAGVMSAFGFLVAPAAFEQLRADLRPLDAVDVASLRRTLAELEREGRAELRSAGAAAARVAVRREAAVRYRGQSFELFVPLPAGRPSRRALAEVEAAFLRQYRRRYHRLNPGVPLEVVSWRVVVSGPRPEPALARAPRRGTTRAARKGRRRVYLPEADGYVECPVYDRYALPARSRLRGPAVIEEEESTAVIGAGAAIEVDDRGNLRVELPRRRPRLRAGSRRPSARA